MSEIQIILPDNSVRTFDHEPTALEVAASIGARLAKDTLGAKINGQTEVIDFRVPLKNGTKLQLITTKSPEALDVIRHSAAHLMAQAVQEIWPEVKVTIGPVIENGFYYDFDSSFNFTEEHFEKIEKKMEELQKKDLPLTRENWPIAKAIDVFKSMNERFKVELIQGLADKGETEVGIYHQAQWFDLCRGPHVQSTGQIKAFKLMSVAGAYWRGDEKNPMLQRVYATAFLDKKELEQHLVQLEEAKKRDHRKLGKELGLFMFHEFAPASPFFTGRGTIVYNELTKYIRELYFKFDYQEVITPQVFNVELFKKSGHYQNYKDNMYFTFQDEQENGLKPMNCPSHCLLFDSSKHSYRELPLRMADFGRLHRYEKSGSLHGLSRVRTFCQDDAHIFCTLDQLKTEIASFIDLLNTIYNTLGMPNYKIKLATRPEKRMGSDEVWDQSEGALASALTELNIPFEILPGEGAFYGPKLEMHFIDAIGRSWQTGTVQVDYVMPESFNLLYTGEDNKEHRPVMLHRAVLGSLERFISVYLEHTAGHLPPWLSPTQVVILNVTDRVNDFCEQIEKEMKLDHLRVEFDRRSEKLNYKIREAQLKKIPFMIIIGDKEASLKSVSIRLSSGVLHNDISWDSARKIILQNIKERKLQAEITQAETPLT
ncbi:MAG: threonine--tRNA ligase [Bdellovibrionota bacterium]